MALVRLILNPSYPGTELLIPDLGDLLADGINEDYSTAISIRRLLDSRDLYQYITDNAYGANQSTVLVNDGASNLPTAGAQEYIAKQYTLASGSSVYSQSEKDAIELETAFKASAAFHYKELVYTGELLTQMNVWTDNTMTTKLFQIDYTYTGEQLTTVVVTRISDSATLTKTLAYTGDTLDSIEKS